MAWNTVRRVCKAEAVKGWSCRAAPLHDGDYCLFHDPVHAAAVQKARRAGGLRRRKDAAVAATHDFMGLGSATDLVRLLEIAIFDVLAAEPSLARARVLAYLVQMAGPVLEKAERELRASVEADLHENAMALDAGDARQRLLDKLNRRAKPSKPSDAESGPADKNHT